MEKLKLTLDNLAKKLEKYLKKECEINLDKLNLFIAQDKGWISKIYKYAIRRQFLSYRHSSFEKRWLTVFN